eukprot:GSChrysophyteH1.ASY1.ANO1.1298.1 assembled CDS
MPKDIQLARRTLYGFGG